MIGGGVDEVAVGADDLTGVDDVVTGGGVDETFCVDETTCVDVIKLGTKLDVSTCSTEDVISATGVKIEVGNTSGTYDEV